MAFEYEAERFFVRDCYPIYYAQIKELLFSRRKKYISVTGTPGIGKSIFYLYVFNRYREEFPDKTIVTASFTKDRDLVKCVVFYPDGRVEPCLKPDGDFHIPTIYKVPDAIHLYDGPPKVQPPDSQMVAFTSPNEDWLNSIYKAANHCKLYMPVWKFEELCDANEQLDSKITIEDLKKDYGRFGGVPRYCLAYSEETRKEGLAMIESALGKFYSFDDVQACIDGRKDLTEVVHRLFHYMPEKFQDTHFCFFASLRFGSIWIAAKVEERIRDRQNITRSELLRWLNGVGKAGVLFGWLFEQYAHEIFQEGGRFFLSSLQNNEKKELVLNPQIGHYEKFTTSASLEKVFQDIYMIPNSNNFESLDSFYYSEADQKIYAFQITGSLVHNVKAYGLVKLLELTGLMDETLKGSIQLILVFVIPRGNGDRFKKQNIIFDDIPAIDDLPEYPLSHVKGMGGGKRYKRLREEVGITSGKELYDAVKRNAPEISFVRSIGLEFVEKVDARSSWSFLSTIPQFFIEISLA